MRGARFGLMNLAGMALAAACHADSPAPDSAMLPTPYSAEQIREAWRPGFRVEMRTIESGAETRSRMTVIAATAEAGTIRAEQLGASGEVSEPPREFTTKWSELRDHASFEAAKATRERAECHSQLGAMLGWRYSTTSENGDALSMCFADATPGPPVEHETRREGALLSRTEHASYGRPTSGAEEKL